MRRIVALISPCSCCEVDALEHERAQRQHRARRSRRSARCRLRAPTSRRGRARACRCAASPFRRARRSRRCGSSSAESIPARIASSMSWLMYATRSTMRTIFPSSVSGSSGPVCLRIPSRTSRGEVEPAAVALERLDDAQRVLVVTEAVGATLAQQLVERLLARVAEGRVAEIVAEPDRLDEILVQPERPADAACDAGRLERVREPCTEMVALRDRRRPASCAGAAERLRVHDPVAVALERRAQAALLLGRARPRLS